MHMVLYLSTWKVIDFSFHPIELILLFALFAVSNYASMHNRHRHEDFPGWLNKLGRRERNVDVLPAWINPHSNKQIEVQKKSTAIREPEWGTQVNEIPNKHARSQQENQAAYQKPFSEISEFNKDPNVQLDDSVPDEDAGKWGRSDDNTKVETQHHHVSCNYNKEWEKLPSWEERPRKGRSNETRNWGPWGSKVAYYDDDCIQVRRPGHGRYRSLSPDSSHSNGHRGRSRVRRGRNDWGTDVQPKSHSGGDSECKQTSEPENERNLKSTDYW